MILPIVSGAEAFSSAYFGAGTGRTFLDNVQCSGTEMHVLSCPSNAIRQENCNHNDDAGVRCPGRNELIHQEHLIHSLLFGKVLAMMEKSDWKEPTSTMKEECKCVTTTLGERYVIRHGV